MSPNLTAFLTMIAESEGTRLPGTDDGYRCIVGSRASLPIIAFQSYADHPRIKVHLKAGLSSTAAGRYQILERYYDSYLASLGLPDFSPASQDRIAVQLITECRALALVEAGDIEEAIYRCRSRWASLPGAGYNQHERPMAFLTNAYRQAGGVVA